MILSWVEEGTPEFPGREGRGHGLKTQIEYYSEDLMHTHLEASRVVPRPEEA